MRICITYVWVSLLSMGLIMLSVPSYTLRDSEAASHEGGHRGIEESVGVTSQFEDNAAINNSKGVTTGRTLKKYYARRQYPGAPPEIPHPDKVHGKNLECLVCHADGGWTSLLKRITPVTPHPELTGCMQCHVSPVTATLFKGINWKSLPPPRLGRTYLPGAPPPIPHDLQMRKNCNACHVGPGTLMAIRMKHEWRGNCRQCHLPEATVELFIRKVGTR